MFTYMLKTEFWTFECALYWITMPFEVQVDQYQGPLAKLLELIEARQLDVSRISLAEITFAFLEHIREIERETPPAVLADFLVIAARLVLIKSKQLLPTLVLTVEEESEAHDLEARLALYRVFAARGGAAVRQLRERFENPCLRSFGRPFTLTVSAGPIFYPSENLTVATLRTSLTMISRELAQLVAPEQTVKRLVISLEQKVSELMERCKNAARASFHALATNRPREEVIVMFIALLHLLKQRSISVEQGDVFSDIIVKRAS